MWLPALLPLRTPKEGENRKETESSQSATTKQDTWDGCYGVCVARSLHEQGLVGVPNSGTRSLDGGGPGGPWSLRLRYWGIHSCKISGASPVTSSLPGKWAGVGGREGLRTPVKRESTQDFKSPIWARLSVKGRVGRGFFLLSPPPQTGMHPDS